MKVARLSDFSERNRLRRAADDCTYLCLALGEIYAIHSSATFNATTDWHRWREAIIHRVFIDLSQIDNNSPSPDDLQAVASPRTFDRTTFHNPFMNGVALRTQAKLKSFGTTWTNF